MAFPLLSQVGSTVSLPCYEGFTNIAIWPAPQSVSGKNFHYWNTLLLFYKESDFSIYFTFINPIPGVPLSWQFLSRGGKNDCATYLAIFWSFQVRLEWYQKWNPRTEAPCRKKWKNFDNWPRNRNFCSPYKNSENFWKYFFSNIKLL